MRIAWQLVLVSIAASSCAEAVSDDEAARPCCQEHAESEGSHCAGCRDAQPIPLASLREDATPKERWLREIHDTIDARRHYYLSRSLLDEFRQRWESAEAAGDVKAILSARLWYASYLLYHGSIEDSIGHFEGCVAHIEEHPDDFPESTTKEALYRLGLACFRLAERRNCIAHHNQESCIFPLRGGAVHIEKDGAAATAEVMGRLLELDPEYSEARWLLNLAHQALGTWPDGVPEEQRYPPERFASTADVGRFLDVAPVLGLDRFDRAGSALLDDLDCDGWVDVLTCSFDSGSPLALHRNAGDGTFRDVTAEAGLANQLGGTNLVQGDVDGDGLLDVLVLRGGGLYQAGELPCSLLRQVEPGRFEDVTSAAGIEVAAPTSSAAFADIDLDGDLDLFIGYESMKEQGAVKYPSRLYRNDGEGRFEEITDASGVSNDGICVAVAFGDVDGDGYPDLFLSNQFSRNKLYRNTGDGTFDDVTAQAGVEEPRTSRGALFFDHDNDGDLDLFVAFHDHGQAVERAVARWYEDGTILAGTPRLYRNDGGGSFADVTARVGLERVVYARSAAYADVDHDGFPDLYLATGAGGMAALWPNLLLVNDGGRAFRDATEAAGVGHLQKGQAVAFADLDHDGDEDLFVQVGGHHFDDGFGDVLFENPGRGNRFLGVELEGVGSNRFGIGARVHARLRTADGERSVFGFVGPRGSAGGSALRLELGLGRAEKILFLEVLWPGAREEQRFEDVALDSFVRVREGSAELALLERPAVRLGGGE